MSNSNVVVPLPFHCDRTGKDTTEAVPLSEAETFLEGQAKKTQIGVQLATQLVEVGLLPDLVVVFRGEVHVLANVHSSNDAGVKRYINELLKRPVYAVAEPRKRKPRTPADASAADFDLPVDEG